MDLFRRVRWGNVGRAAALVGVVALIVLWPRLRSGPPELPAAPAAGAPPVSLAEPGPLPEAGEGGVAEVPAARRVERRRAERPRSEGRPRRGRRRPARAAAARRRVAEAAKGEAPAAAPVEPPARAPAPLSGGSGSEFGFE